MTRARQNPAPTTIWFARVMAVHPEEYSVDVTSEYLGQQALRAPYCSMYVHHANGEGTYFIPEVGSWCWLCIPSDHNRPFVLSFMPPFSEVDDYKATRLDLQAGDQAMISRDLNGIIVRRGGITQVSATPVCQRIYSPVANTIRDICENYELNTAGGQLKWTVKRSTPTEQALSPTVLVLEAREFAQSDPAVIIKIGSVETPKTVAPAGPKISAARKVYLDIEVPGLTGPAYQYRVNLDGESLLVQEGQRSIRVKDSEIHFVEGAKRELKIFGNEVKTVNGSSTRTYTDEDVQVRTTSKERAGTKKVIIAPQVFLGDEVGAVPAVLGPALLAWLNTHTHISAAPGSPTTPPVSPALQNLLAKKVKIK